MEQSKYCIRCSAQFFKKPNCRGANWTARKYCSQLCQRLAAIASSNSYRVISEQGRRALSANGKRNIERLKKTQFKTGEGLAEANHKWKGDDASYAAKHMWIKYHYGKPKHCEHCGIHEDRKYHWANVSNRYLRIRSDWLSLCVPCHKRFDLNRRKDMVKDNKFAAEPTADSTADSKIDQKAAKITTTENVVHDQENPKTEKHLKEAKGSKEDKWYEAYVKGDSIQSIADEAKVEAAEVLSSIEKKEADRDEKQSK